MVCVPAPCFFGFWSNCEYYMLWDQKSKLFINSKVFLGLESVFLKCVYIWWLYYNLTDVALDNLQIEAHLKDGLDLDWPCVCN